MPDAISRNDVYEDVSSIARSACVLTKASDKKPRLMRPGFLMRAFINCTAFAKFVKEREKAVRTLKTRATLFVMALCLA